MDAMRVAVIDVLSAASFQRGLPLPELDALEVGIEHDAYAADAAGNSLRVNGRTIDRPETGPAAPR